MKHLLLILICVCICTLSLKGENEEIFLWDQLIKRDTLPIAVDSNHLLINNYVIVYPSSYENHLLIKQLERKEMHIRLRNMGGQVLREQWTKALETDLYVKNLKGLFIVEIEYEGGEFSKTVVVQ